MTDLTRAISHSLLPSAALLKCDGQDITRRGGKGKSRIMLVLPAQLAFMKGTEGTLGTLDKINTDHPEFIVPTSEGDLVFKGRFIESDTTCYLGIEPTPRKMHSVCTDVVSRLLVFDDPSLVPRDINAMSPPATLPRGESIVSTAADEILLTQDTLVASQGTAEGSEPVNSNVWHLFHGCSAHARYFDKAEASFKRDISLSAYTGGDDIDGDIEFADDGSVSDYGDIRSKSAAKGKKPVAKALKRLAAEDDAASEVSAGSDAPRRASSARATKRAVRYTEDDVPSEDKMDEDDLVLNVKVTKQKEISEALSDQIITFKKKTSTPPKNAGKNEAKRAQKLTVAKKTAARQKKKSFDFPSSDEDYCEDVEESSPQIPLKRAQGSRPARSATKKPKKYHVSSGSSDDEYIE